MGKTQSKPLVAWHGRGTAWYMLISLKQSPVLEKLILAWVVKKTPFLLQIIRFIMAYHWIHPEWHKSSSWYQYLWYIVIFYYFCVG
jgi:hypothetical protein